jgi:hypothetical protein
MESVPLQGEPFATGGACYGTEHEHAECFHQRLAHEPVVACSE